MASILRCQVCGKVIREKPVTRKTCCVNSLYVFCSEALEKAECLGYAERNGSHDLNGLDTASKLVIIAYHVLKNPYA